MSLDKCVSTSEMHLQELSDLLAERLNERDRRAIKCDTTLESMADRLYPELVKDNSIRELLAKLSTSKSCQISAIRDALHLLRGDLPAKPAVTQPEQGILEKHLLAKELVLQG